MEGYKPVLVPHQEEELYACQRGCRLFSICQFVDDGIDLNRTKLECDSGKTSALLQHPIMWTHNRGRSRKRCCYIGGITSVAFWFCLTTSETLYMGCEKKDKQLLGKVFCSLQVSPYLSLSVAVFLARS